jgi:hypothetical protein
MQSLPTSNESRDPLSRRDGRSHFHPVESAMLGQDRPAARRRVTVPVPNAESPVQRAFEYHHQVRLPLISAGAG